MVFVVETSEGDDFATRRISTLEIVNLVAFSVSKETAVTGIRAGFMGSRGPWPLAPHQ